MSAPIPTLLRYRSAWTQVAGWFIVLSAALAVVDSVFRAASGARLGSALLAVGVALVAYVWGLRPAVMERADALEVRNPLRTSELPWSSITDVDAIDVVRVTAGDLVVRCFAIPRRMRVTRSVGIPGMPPSPVPFEDTSAKDPVMRFRSMAETFGSSGSGEPRQWWAPVAVAALGIGVVLIVVGLLLLARG